MWKVVFLALHVDFQNVDEGVRMKEDLNFSEALELLKQGKKVARRGWNGKGMYLYIVKVELPSYEFFNDLDFTNEICNGLAEFIVMLTTNNNLIPWLASQADILAEDYVNI